MDSNSGARLFALSSPITVTPEPSTLTLLGVSAMGLIAYFWRRRRAKGIVRFSLAAAVLVSAVTVRAQTTNVFHMPSGETSLQFVTVGDPGNTANPSTGYGAVGYTYQMGKYDVTARSTPCS